MLSFMGLLEYYKNADAVVVPVPYEETVFYRKGTKKGPKEILEASLKLEDFDFEAKRDLLEGIKIHTTEPFVPPEKPEDAVIKIEEYFTSIFEDKKFPVAIGGEHSISVGITKAAKKFHDFSVLQIDAHADLFDGYTGTKLSHACTMRRIREFTPSVHVGVRSLGREEYEYIKKENLEDYIHPVEFDADKVLGQLSENIYITVDMDVFDPSEVPGVGTPEPGGLRWKEVINLLEKVSKKKKIIGFDVVELAPVPDSVVSEFTAAKLIYKMMGYSFGG